MPNAQIIIIFVHFCNRSVKRRQESWEKNQGETHCKWPQGGFEPCFSLTVYGSTHVKRDLISSVSLSG